MMVHRHRPRRQSREVRYRLWRSWEYVLSDWVRDVDENIPPFPSLPHWWFWQVLFGITLGARKAPKFGIHDLNARVVPINQREDIVQQLPRLDMSQCLPFFLGHPYPQLDSWMPFSAFRAAAPFFYTSWLVHELWWRCDLLITQSHPFGLHAWTKAEEAERRISGIWSWYKWDGWLG